MYILVLLSMPQIQLGRWCMLLIYHCLSFQCHMECKLFRNSQLMDQKTVVFQQCTACMLLCLMQRRCRWSMICNRRSWPLKVLDIGRWYTLGKCRTEWQRQIQEDKLLIAPWLKRKLVLLELLCSRRSLKCLTSGTSHERSHRTARWMKVQRAQRCRFYTQQMAARFDLGSVQRRSRCRQLSWT